MPRKYSIERNAEDPSAEFARINIRDDKIYRTVTMVIAKSATMV
jgi:hypothetical protein